MNRRVEIEEADACECLTSIGARCRVAGYSLIELLVVCALVAILAALSVPSYSAARRVVYNNVALSDLMQARTVMQGQVANLKKGNVVVVGPAAFPGTTVLRVSKNVRLTIQNTTPGSATVEPKYTITAKHNLGTATYTVTEAGKVTASGAKL